MICDPNEIGQVTLDSILATCPSRNECKSLTPLVEKPKTVTANPDTSRDLLLEPSVYMCMLPIPEFHPALHLATNWSEIGDRGIEAGMSILKGLFVQGCISATMASKSTGIESWKLIEGSAALPGASPLPLDRERLLDSLP